MNNEEFDIDLLRVFKALLKKAWAIILATAIFAGAFLGGSVLFVEPLYRAESLMYVNSSNISVGGTKVSISQSELTAAKTLVDTYIVILNTRMTLDSVIEKSGVPYSYSKLKSMIKATAVNDTEVFSIQVTSPDPEEAALIANTIAEVLPEKIASIVEGSSARIVDYAVVPVSQASPNLSKNMMLGAVLGFLLSCVVVVVAELMDNLIYDSDYLSETYDIPVLAVIPDFRSGKRSDDYYRGAESYEHK